MKDIFNSSSLKDNVQSNINVDITQEHYLETIQSFSRMTYKSIYVIDYETKKFEYVSDNPLFLCGNTAKEVKEMSYNFYTNFVVKEDLDLLLKVNNAWFNFFNKIPLKERKLYTLLYDFRLKNEYGKKFLVNHKLTPLFLTDNGEIKKAMCIVSLSSRHNSGNVKIYKRDSKTFWKYDLENYFWKPIDKPILTEREKEILSLSVQGNTINETAKILFISPTTVRFHRHKLFEDLGVNNITEAIAFATNNKLI